MHTEVCGLPFFFFFTYFCLFFLIPPSPSVLLSFVFFFPSSSLPSSQRREAVLQCLPVPGSHHQYSSHITLPFSPSLSLHLSLPPSLSFSLFCSFSGADTQQSGTYKMQPMPRSRMPSTEGVKTCPQTCPQREPGITAHKLSSD